ncbi:MAG: DMT family transporter [Candidatus Saccharibacteria bacterium]|nr:DMT family transporter [Rhodoferax sp.]
MKLSHLTAVILMLVVTLMWSTAGVVTRHLDAARSFEVTYWRSFFTAASLMVILPLWQGRKVWRDIRSGGRLLWLSGLCWCVMFTAFMVALTLTSVSNVLVTMALGPLLTALIARIFLGHRIATRTLAAMGIAGIGIVVMYAEQLSSDQWLGSLVALCVPLAGATHWTVTQRAHSEGHDVDLVPAVLIGAVLSSLLSLPLAFPFQATPHDLGLLSFLGLFQLAIPCVLSVICARVLKAAEIALLALLEVIFGIILAWLGAGETPQSSVLLGGSLVIGALVVNEWLGLIQRRTTP